MLHEHIYSYTSWFWSLKLYYWVVVGLTQYDSPILLTDSYLFISVQQESSVLDLKNLLITLPAGQTLKSRTLTHTQQAQNID